MLRIIKLAGGAAIAIAMIVAAAAPSYAAPHGPHGGDGDDPGAAVVGGMLGFMAGAAAADGGRFDGPPRHRRSDWRDHVEACLDHYGRRYDPRTDLVRFHGDVFKCDDWDGPPRHGGPWDHMH